MDSLLGDELPEIVNNGVFGKNLKYVSFDVDKDSVAQDQYMSTVIFGTVTTSDESRHRVLIKLKLRDEKMRVKFKIDLQFHNEIIMYERVIPFLLECHRSLKVEVGNYPTLPQFFYGRNKCGEFVEKDLIVLENVAPLGFKLSEARPFLDYDHLVAASRAIAKFHGLSYTAKHKDPERFKKIIMDFRDTQFDANGRWTFKNNALIRFSKRGVNRLLDRSGDLYRENEHLRRFNELTEDGINSLRRALVPREPFSVACHGDFNRNNVLFRYEEGLPVDVLMFDFGTPRYGSPALDLSFFLYMNTTQSLRESRWDDLLNVYCLTLEEFVPPGVRVPNRNELDSEMATHALFGFAHASFFLPHQLETDVVHKENMDEEGIIQWLLELGGENGTDKVADLVQHIVDMGYTNVLPS